MRLICPSCGATYEVDESVIPEAGRDVQCSNCGHAWFQMSAAQLKAQEEREAAASEAEPDESEVWTEEEPSGEEETQVEAGAEVSEEIAEEAEAAEDALEPAEPEPEPEEPASAPSEVTAAAEPTPEVQETASEAATEPEAEVAPAQDEDAAGPEAGPEPESRRKTLDDAMLNVLREEAEREHRAREAEGSVIETQPDLGIAAVTPIAPIGAAAAASSAQRDDDDEIGFVDDDERDDADAVMSRASRRELLPDIEEINSTLRATSDRGAEAASVDAPATLRRRRSGFRMGFSTAILIAAVLLLLYIMAPTIAEKIPASAPIMAAYVSAIDGVRAWIDATLQSFTASMTGDAN